MLKSPEVTAQQNAKKWHVFKFSAFSEYHGHLIPVPRYQRFPLSIIEYFELPEQNIYNLPYALHCPEWNSGFVRYQQAPVGSLTEHLDNNVKPKTRIVTSFES